MSGPALVTNSSEQNQNQPILQAPFITLIDYFPGTAKDLDQFIKNNTFKTLIEEIKNYLNVKQISIETFSKDLDKFRKLSEPSFQKLTSITTSLITENQLKKAINPLMDQVNNSGKQIHDITSSVQSLEEEHQIFTNIISFGKKVSFAVLQQFGLGGIKSIISETDDSWKQKALQGVMQSTVNAIAENKWDEKIPEYKHIQSYVQSHIDANQQTKTEQKK